MALTLIQPRSLIQRNARNSSPRLLKYDLRWSKIALWSSSKLFEALQGPLMRHFAGPHKIVPSATDTQDAFFDATAVQDHDFAQHFIAGTTFAGRSSWPSGWQPPSKKHKPCQQMQMLIYYKNESS
eukprot:scaffold11868_cov111-Skeletonema_dohrnii-CCMP3373.AAC.2